jgi:hypothetical protein
MLAEMHRLLLAVSLAALAVACGDDRPAPPAPTSASAPVSAALAPSARPSASASAAEAIAYPSASTAPVIPPTHQASATPPQPPAPAPAASATYAARWVDGKRLAISVNGYTHVLDASAIDAPRVVFGPHQELVEPIMAFAGGRKGIERVALPGKAKAVVVYDGGGKQLLELPVQSEVLGLSFSSDGKRLAAAAGDTVHAWSVAEGKPIGSYEMQTGYAAAFSRDGKTLTAVGPGLVRVWQLDSGKVLTDQSLATGAYGLSLSPDGEYAIDAEQAHALVLYRTHPWARLSMLEAVSSCEEHLWSRFSPDGKTLTVGAGQRWQRAYFIPNWKRTKPFYLPAEASEIMAVADNGQRALVIDKEGDLSVWHMWAQQKVIGVARVAVEPAPTGMLSPDALYMAVVSGDGVRVWLVADGRELIHLDAKALAAPKR